MTSSPCKNCLTKSDFPNCLYSCDILKKVQHFDDQMRKISIAGYCTAKNVFKTEHKILT